MEVELAQNQKNDQSSCRGLNQKYNQTSGQKPGLELNQSFKNYRVRFEMLLLLLETFDCDVI